jgi:polyhydroxybutyrate depolymerase
MHVRNYLVPLLPALGLALMGCTESEKSDLGTYAYPEGNTAVACESPSKGIDLAGATDGERTSKGIRFNVRTPANYNPKVAHPLIVVFAPAGHSAAASERFTGLTRIATTAGFVIAYPDHVRNAIPVIEELSTIPGLVAKKWCIDEARVYLTGHSDGGTVTFATAIMDRTKDIPAAIAPSAAGFTKADLAEFECRTPLSVMIIHSAKDMLFPGFGAEAAAWWAACNQCEPTPGMRMDKGCVTYPNCAGGVTTQYCEGTELHARWPALNQSIIDFFTAAGRP